MTLSMVSSAFQAFLEEEIGGKTDSNFIAQCVHALIRILLLSATFVLVHRTLNSQRTSKATAPSRFTKSLPKKNSTFKGKRRFCPPSDNEDAVSTSVGSSDSESDLLSSDQEEDVKGGKISVLELLRRRPPAGIAPQGSLCAMPVASSQPRARDWNAVRATVQPKSPAKTVSRFESKAEAKTIKSCTKAAKADSKPVSKPPPTPMKGKILPVPAKEDASKAAANSARMQALLEIICPEEIEKKQETSYTL